jgi:hypothetical protein
VIIKSLVRGSGGGGSAATISYILRYALKKEKSASKKATKVFEEDLETLRLEYIKALSEAKVRFTRQDIDHLIAEHLDGMLLTDMQAKEMNDNISGYIDKYIMPLYDVHLQVSDKKLTTNSDFIITHNIRSKTIDGFIKEFTENEAGRVHKRSNQPTVHHTIVSFGAADREKITDAMLRDIGHEFIRLRGEDLLYVGTKHRDRDHVHLHFAVSPTKVNGLSARISKKQFEELKLQLQQYHLEHYPEVIHSAPEHGRKGLEIKKEAEKNKKTNERASVKNALLECIGTLKPQSTSQLIDALQTEGFSTYYRSGKLTGLQHTSGLKFRLSKLGIDPQMLDAKSREKEANSLKELQDIRRVRDARDKCIE